MGFNAGVPDVLTAGVGVVVFLVTILTVFVFFGARSEKFGRPALVMLVASMMWAWFTFFSQITTDPSIAREFAIASIIGFVWIPITAVSFAVMYLNERFASRRLVTILWQVLFFSAAVLSGLLLSDLMFDTQFMVMDIEGALRATLAPEMTPLFYLAAAQYLLTIVATGVLLLASAKHSVSKPDRLQSLGLFAAMSVSLLLIATRFLGWYSLNVSALYCAAGVALFALTALYTIQRYRLFNVDVIVAQLLIFALWSCMFFRILLDQTPAAAVPDVALLGAALLIGIYFIRLVVVEVRTEKELARLTVEKAKSDFVAVAAHQLRTPLSAVRWSVNALLAKMPSDDKNRESAAMAGRAADNMMYIINDLLTTSRLSDGHMTYDMRESDLRDIAREAVTVLGDAAAAKKIALQLDIPAAPIITLIDHDKMVMVAENLVDNAIKYTPNEGTVTVAVDLNDGHARLRVIDTGIGLTLDERTHVFERFYRSERAKHTVADGSGLGLYIVKTIVEAHKGQVTLGPGQGKGAVATVDIPLARPT
jgi:signal transduction histidine kinase